MNKEEQKEVEKVLQLSLFIEWFIEQLEKEARPEFKDNIKALKVIDQILESTKTKYVELYEELLKEKIDKFKQERKN